MSISASELRIGNVVKSTTHNQITIINLIDEYGDYSKIEGVAITEDWLENFGFIESETCFKNGFLMFRFYESGLFIPNIGSVELKEIKYVHDIQNLYYAISGGNELTLSKPF